jgi:hypothetical protein
MNHFVLFAISCGFGSLAWIMLAISDWLLGDKPPRPATSRAQLPPLNRLTKKRTFARSASPRAIVPAARKAS